MRAISHSEMTTFTRCSREHFYRYRLNRVPSETEEPLAFGSLIHRALEQWWLGGDWRATCESNVTALALMIGYDARWQGEAYEVLGAELGFRAPIVNPDTGKASKTYELQGVLDVLAVDKSTGETVLIEHKTTSQDIGVGATYWRTRTFDSQLLAYHIGAQALGHAVQRVVYDVIRKPTIKRALATPEAARKYTKDGRLYANQRADDETEQEFFARLCESIAEDPSRHYARASLVRLERDEREHASDLWHTARLIRESELLNRTPRNPQSCERYGRLCPYFGVCAGEANIEDFAVRERKEVTHGN
ncbi:MAG: hypothetical protein EBR82_12295 [Caulobacteraceae bacterium]|nr:hypothetical protein [Caulobacteraceae bacterium]